MLLNILFKIPLVPFKTGKLYWHILTIYLIYVYNIALEKRLHISFLIFCPVFDLRRTPYGNDLKTRSEPLLR